MYPRALIFTLLFSLVRTDLVGLYTLDASDGIVAKDSSPLQNDGIIVHGNLGWVPNGGKIGGAFNFSVGVCGSFQRLVRTDFTLMFWMKTNSNGSNTNQWYWGQGLVDAEVATSTTDFGTALMNGKVGFGLGPSDTTISSNTFISDGKWHHVAAVRSVTSSGNSVINSLSLYIDGVEDIWIVQAPYLNTQPRDAAPDISFGCIQETRSNLFNGLLDQIRIYNNSVSAEDIKSIYDIEATGVLPTTAISSSTALPSTVPSSSTVASSTVPSSSAIRSSTVPSSSATTRPTVPLSTPPPSTPPRTLPLPTLTSTSYQTGVIITPSSSGNSNTAEILAILFGCVALIESVALAGIIFVLLKKRRASYFQLDNMDHTIVEEQ